MTRRYIPVAAKRRALEIYRHRRLYGEAPLYSAPMRPIDAMRSTVQFFEGHLAFVVDRGTPEQVKALLGEYRAADHYLDRMYDKPWRNKFRPAAGARALGA